MTRTRGEHAHDQRPSRPSHVGVLELANPAALIDRFPIPTLLLVEYGRLAHANAAAVALLQLDDDHQLAAAVEDFLGLRDEIEQTHRRQKSGGVIERELTVADGTSLQVQLFLTPAGASPYRSTLVHLVDRTAEASLRAFVSRSTPGLEGLFQRLPVVSALVGPSGAVELWNKEAERRLGVSSGQAIGRALTDVLRVGNATLRREIETAIATGQRVDRRVVIARPEKRTALTLDLSLEPWVDENGRGIGAIAALADVTGRDDNERRHARSALLYQHMLTSLDETVTLLDAEGTVVGTNPFSQEEHGSSAQPPGYPDSFWKGADLFALVHEDDRQRAADLLREAKANPGGSARAQLRLRDPQSPVQNIEGTAWNLLDDPAVGAILLVTRDITRLLRETAQRDAQATILRLIAEGQKLDPILIKIALFLDRQLDQAEAAVALASPAVTAFGNATAATQQAIVGLPLATFDAPVTRANGALGVYVVDGHTAMRTQRQALHANGCQAVWTYPIRAADNEPSIGQIVLLAQSPVDDPTEHELEMIRLASSMVALAVERLRVGEQLAFKALHDELTGLANRHLLIDRLDHALSRARRNKSEVGLMFIDLDRFKTVNDTFGHDAGDAVLKEFAARLNLLLRGADTVARYGGDEFIVVIDEVTELHLREVAQRVEESLAVPIEYKNSVFHVTSSIGLAISGGAVESATDLLHNADAAMYRAKRLGRQRLEIFDEEMRSFTKNRVRQESDLRRSIERGTMLLHYQPIIDLRSGRVVGAEALVRWNHPELGLLEPAEFLPLAEEIGFIGPLGRWILDEALKRASRWSTVTGTRDLWISVNISSRQLVTDELPQLVEDLLQAHRWKPERLILEIAENALLADVDLIKEGLDAIHQLGVDLAIDDFGVGVASLSTLSNYAVDRIKIDRDVVGRLGVDERSIQLARAIIDSAHALGMSVIAEGVEHGEQLDILRSLGCDWAQGFHFHPGMTELELSALLQTNAVW